MPAEVLADFERLILSRLWKLNFHSRNLNEINKTKLPKTVETKVKY